MDQSDMDDINDREQSMAVQQEVDISLTTEQQEQEKEQQGYEKIKVVGQGVFGKKNEIVVMKQISTFAKNQQEIDEIMKEAVILKEFNHPNIIAFHDAFVDKKQRLCIIMEYAPGESSVFQKFQDRRRISLEIKNLQTAYPRKQNFRLVFLNMFGYPSCSQQVDREKERFIKLFSLLEKSFIEILKDEKFVKLGDFGLARAIQGTKDKAMSVVGTPYYISPEIVQNKVIRFKNPYSFKSDIWSLGVLLYEMCSFKWPFQAESIHFLALQILRGKYKPLNPAHYSQALRNLVAQMLQVDANKRPSIEMVISTKIYRNIMKENPLLIQKIKQTTNILGQQIQELHQQKNSLAKLPQAKKGGNASTVYTSQNQQYQEIIKKRQNEEQIKAIKVQKEADKKKQIQMKKEQEKVQKEKEREEERKKMKEDIQKKVIDWVGRENGINYNQIQKIQQKKQSTIPTTEIIIESFGQPKEKDEKSHGDLEVKQKKKQKDIIVEIYLPLNKNEASQQEKVNSKIEEEQKSLADNNENLNPNEQMKNVDESFSDEMNDINEMEEDGKVREMNVAEEESLTFISSDHNKIEVKKQLIYILKELRQLLEDSLGIQIFIKAYQIVKELVNIIIYICY